MSPAGDSRGYESKKSSMASVQVSGTDKARDLKFLKKLEKYRTRSRGSSRANAGFGLAKKLRGAAKGVHVELLRLNPSGKQLCSDNLIEKAKAQGLRDQPRVGDSAPFVWRAVRSAARAVQHRQRPAQQQLPSFG